MLHVLDLTNVCRHSVRLVFGVRIAVLSVASRPSRGSAHLFESNYRAVPSSDVGLDIAVEANIIPIEMMVTTDGCRRREIDAHRRRWRNVRCCGRVLCVLFNRVRDENKRD